MNITDYIINLILILIGVLIITFITFLISLILKNKKDMELDKYEIDINIPIDDKITLLLDSLINDCFQEYLILNIEFQNVTYVGKDLEKQICSDVCHIVAERLSPVLMTKLSIMYNINNITEIIANRVYLKTLDYTISKNEIKKE